MLFYAFDDTGGTTATFDHPYLRQGRVNIVPVDTASFLLVNGTLLQHATAAGIDSIAILPTSDSGASVQYQRLYGNTFLRLALDRNGYDIRAERFLLDGTPVESRDMALHHRSSDLSLALDPRDSSIIILAGSRRGVRMLHLRSDLVPLQEEIQASVTDREVHNPCGIISGDTLHLLWEDYRVGNSDIFGQSLGYPFQDLSYVESQGSAIADRSSTRGISITAVVPNPAEDLASLRFTLAIGGDVVLEIRDMSGRVLRTERRRFGRGENRWDIDTGALADGVYMIGIAAGGRIATTKLMILRVR